MDGMNLDILSPAKKMPLTVGMSRELVSNDLTAELNSTTPALKSIRETHHQLARLLASVLKQVEVSAITGFSQSRISILKADPAFAELIEHYRGVADSAFADVRGQLAGMSLDAVQELRDRLHDQPDSFRNRELMDLATAMLDRTGHGPTSTVNSKNVNVTLTGEALEALKREALKGQVGDVIRNRGEIPTHAISASAEAVPEDTQPVLGRVIELRPESGRRGAEQTEGGAGEGETL